MVNFFFWMDMLGTLSLCFDLVQLLQESLLPQNNAGATADNSVLFRTARVSKVRTVARGVWGETKRMGEFVID